MMKTSASKIALAAAFLVFGYAFSEIIPPDRRITWEGNVGIPGGVPDRTAVFATLNSAAYSNGTADATNAIQTALNNCPLNQVVYLSAGTYRINTSFRISSNIILRGADRLKLVGLPGQQGDQCGLCRTVLQYHRQCVN